MSGAGVPSVEFDVTATGNKLGNFNPRIAASTARNEWMMVTSTAFALASGQRIKTLAAGGGPPPPPPPPPPPIDADRPHRAQRQLVPGRRRGERHGDRVPHVLSRRQRARRSRRRARLVRRRRRHAEVPDVHGRGAEPHDDQPGQRGRTAPSARSSSRRRRATTSSSRARSTGARTSRAAPASRRSRTCPPAGTSPRARAAASCSTTSSSSSTRCPTPTTVDVTFLTAARPGDHQAVPGRRAEAPDALRQRHPRARRQGLQHDDHRGRPASSPSGRCTGG